MPVNRENLKSLENYRAYQREYQREYKQKHQEYNNAYYKKKYVYRKISTIFRNILLDDEKLI